LSSITVDSILRKAEGQGGLQLSQMTTKDLERLYQERISLSVKMFCDDEQLSDIMLDLAELIETIPEDPQR
jgi:hypothetical protein